MIQQSNIEVDPIPELNTVTNSTRSKLSLDEAIQMKASLKKKFIRNLMSSHENKAKEFSYS